MKFIFLFFVLMYAYGEGITEAITHDWKEKRKMRSPFSYHGFRSWESIGIMGMVATGILAFRLFYCIEKNEHPLMLTIGKQAPGQSGIYRLRVFKKDLEIKFPSTNKVPVNFHTNC